MTFDVALGVAIGSGVIAVGVFIIHAYKIVTSR